MDEQRPIPTHHYDEDDTPPQPVDQFVRSVEPVQKAKKKRRLSLIITAVVLLVVCVAAGVWFINKNKKPATSTAPSTSEASAQPKVLIAAELERHSSTQFYLDIDIPKDWTIIDEAGSGVMTATSPNIAIPTGSGTTTGRVVLTMRAPSQKLPEFDKGNATAVTDSEKISYTKPSSAQRGQTYVSYLAYPASASSSLIDGVFITGDFGYTKDQAIPKVDIDKVDPIISITFVACDGACTKGFGITPEAWKSAEFGQPLQKMLQSLTVN